MHTTACTERALEMARENGAPDDATAEAWVAMWDGDGGRDNYGACTCEDDDENYQPAIVREISDIEVWGQRGLAGTDFTITYRYPDAPDEVHHLCIARDQHGAWELRTLAEPHGKVDESAPFPHLPIAQLVIDRCRKVPGMFAGSAPTLAFIEAFFEIR